MAKKKKTDAPKNDFSCEDDLDEAKFCIWLFELIQ